MLRRSVDAWWASVTSYWSPVFRRKDPGQLQGRTENNRVVNFRSDNHALIGTFVDSIVTEALRNSLRGELA